MGKLHCTYCKRGLIHPSRDIPTRNQPVSATRDHVFAKSQGGTATVWACYQCNHLKGDLSLIEWAKFMDANPEWWVWFHSHGQVLRSDPNAPNRRQRKAQEYRVHAIRRRLETFPLVVARPPLCKGLAA